MLPLLCLFALDQGRRLVVDTRDIACNQARLVEVDEAQALLRGASKLSPMVANLLDRGQLAQVDGVFAALACAPYPSSLWEEPPTPQPDQFR